MRWCAAVLCAFLPAALPVGTPSPASVPRFPPGFDWPCSAAAVEGWVAAGDVARIRRHGWYLWAGVSTRGPEGVPLWRAWPTVTQAFAPDATAGAVGTTQKAPAALAGLPHYAIPEVVRARYGIADDVDVLPDGEVFQNSGHIMIATVAYDEDAFAAIRAQGLHRAAELWRRWRSGDRKLGDFPSTSIIVKHMYWPVRHDGPSALPVWDDLPPPETPVYAGYETWKRAVAVDATSLLPPGVRRRVSLLHGVFHGDGTPCEATWDAAVVPADRFYGIALAQRDLDALGRRDRALLDAAFVWAHGRPFEAGDLLISVAMHISTREQPGWTFQSLWWHDRPDEGPYAQDRPDIPPELAPGPWRHYLMTSTYGIVTAAAEGRPARWPVAYNPFIELALGHPIDTNCIACHTRAGWPSASYDDGPGRLDLMRSDDPYFQHLLRTDTQWAIPDRASP